MKNKNILISFIPYHWGGAGAHLAYLNTEFDYDYRLVPISLFKNDKLNRLSIKVQIIFLILFSIPLYLCFRVNATFMHPQTLRYRFAQLIVKFSSKVTYYIVDCHFFCVKSYNIKDGQNHIERLSHN